MHEKTEKVDKLHVYAHLWITHLLIPTITVRLLPSYLQNLVLQIIKTTQYLLPKNERLQTLSTFPPFLLLLLSILFIYPMKIIIVQENLKNALGICSRAVSSSSTLAILGSVLLKTQSGMLKISSTNLEIGISELVRCKVEEEGSVCLPAKLLNEVVSSLPAEPVTLEVVEGGLRLSAGKFRTTLKTVPTEDFPRIADALPAEVVSMPSVALSKALDGVLFSVSTNETQSELCGVSVISKGQSLVVAATDRYRLSEYTVVTGSDKPAPTISVIFPTRAVAEVVRLLHANEGTDVVFGVAENQAVFTIGNTTVSTRLVDGQFPEYEAIIPKDFLVTIEAGKQECIAALRAVSVFSKGAVGVSFQYDEDEQNIHFAAQSQDAGEGAVDVEAKISGGSGTALFNPRYLLDVLQFLTSGSVRVKLNSPTSAVVFEDPEDKQYRYLVMPIKT